MDKIAFFRRSDMLLIEVVDIDFKNISPMREYIPVIIGKKFDFRLKKSKLINNELISRYPTSSKAVKGEDGKIYTETTYSSYVKNGSWPKGLVPITEAEMSK